MKVWMLESMPRNGLQALCAVTPSAVKPAPAVYSDLLVLPAAQLKRVVSIHGTAGFVVMADGNAMAVVRAHGQELSSRKLGKSKYLGRITITRRSRSLSQYGQRGAGNGVGGGGAATAAVCL